MASRAEVLFHRFLFIVSCWVLVPVSLVIHLIHLPLRIVQKLFTKEEKAPEPEVNVILHEPVKGGSAPKDTLVFVHGFPDGPALFDASVKCFTEDGYRCVAVELPGARGERVPYALRPMDLIDKIYHAITAVQDGPVTIIGHDWGAFYTEFMARAYPDKFKRVVLLDVALFSEMDPSVWIAIASYQSMLALMYLLGRPAGYIGMHALLRYLGFEARPLRELTVDMCYPYLGLLRGIAQEVLQGKPVFRVTAVKGRKIPHLFLYGTHKNFSFHDAKWLDFVKTTPGGEVVGMPCHHWISVELPKETNELVGSWLLKTESVVAAE